MIYYYDEESGESTETASDALPELNEIYKTVDEILTQHRPERYVLNSSDWMSPAVAAATELLNGRDYQTIIKRTAWGIAKQREGIAKRRAAAFFRDLAETGAVPIGWGGPDWQIVMVDQLHLPVPINETDVVRLGALGFEDCNECELFQKRRFEERELLADKERAGLAVLRAMLQNQSAHRVDRLTFK